MRRILITICLALISTGIAAGGIAAQEAASEEERVLLDAALANWEAARSWRADFTFAIQFDGDLALPGLSVTMEMDALEGSGSFTLIDSYEAFALDMSLSIPLLATIATAMPGSDHYEMQLIYAEDELHITLDDGAERFHEALPFNAELYAEATEFEAALMALTEEHSEWWRLPDADGRTVLQSELDGRALMLDPALAPLLIDTLRWLEDYTSETVSWSDVSTGNDLDIADFSELAAVLELMQLFVEEATVRTTYLLDAESEELRELVQEAELIISLAALALLVSEGEPLDELDGELRLIMSAEATISGYGETFPLPSLPQ